MPYVEVDVHLPVGVVVVGRLPEDSPTSSSMSSTLSEPLVRTSVRSSSLATRWVGQKNPTFPRDS